MGCSRFLMKMLERNNNEDVERKEVTKSHAW
jgi:hypothetical protein